MALQTTQTISRSTTGGGLVPAYVAATASDTFVPGETVFLHIKNGSGVSINATVLVQAAGPIDNVGLAASKQYAVAAGTERMVGPFPPAYFADPVTGLATVNFSATTSVTYGVFNMTQP
jgi:hypothetical protein